MADPTARRARWHLWFSLLPLLLGCDPASGLDVPRLVKGPSPEIPGKFVTHSLITTEPESAKAFYGYAFDWEFETVGDGRYTIARSNGRNVGGIVDATGARQALAVPVWLGGVSVPDVGEAVAKAKSAGARQLLNILDIPDLGRIAVLSDPEGAVFQVVRAVGGDPPDTAASNHAWLWNELAVTAPDAAARFYQTVFGYRIDLIESPGAAPYLVLSRDGQARAGIRGESDESSKSSWVPYLQVADLDAALSRVRSLGATVVAESSGAGGADAAIIVDPSGAMVALQHASDERALALGFRGFSTP